MKKLIKAIFGAIYKVLSLLNLQFALLVLFVGLVLYICGVFEGGGIPLLIFTLLFIGSLLAAVIITIAKIFGAGKDKKKDKDSSVQIVSQTEEESNTKQSTPEQTSFESQQTQDIDFVQPNEFDKKNIEEEKPCYYRVKQNPNYMMAEYSNRYELYLITPQGLRKVRTDYK